MSWLRQRLVIIMTLSFLALVIAQAEPSGLLAAGLATILVAAALSARHAAVAVRSLELTVGSRAREHREVLSVMPEPRHPNTAGRPRTRAPAQPPPAA
ncbi:hypothetical protein ACX3O0_02340 [Homoserinimonas sp. A447]